MRKGFTLVELLTAITAIILIFYLFRGIFVDESLAVQALENQGFTHVEIVERNWFLVGLRGCDSKDAAIFVADATNPIGKKVQLDVCVGWPLKGATLRSN